jgi:uncharacterized protein (TIGR00661 family)
MTGKKVLIVPLNWGLGHATRIVPVIKKLISKGAEVYIAGSPSHLAFLTKEFDGIRTVRIPYLNIKLNNSKSQILNIARQIPVIILQIIREHKALKKLLSYQHFDIVISDNCYGLWNRKVHSVFITHQVSIKMPDKIKFMEKPVNILNHWFTNKYEICWIPDYENSPSLAGELSHSRFIKSNMVYIGPLSRFYSSDYQFFEATDTRIKQILFIISGPETQRTLFESIIKTQIENLKKVYACIVVRGLPDNSDNNLPEGWFNHLSTDVMKNFILQSDYIVCRPGYSTVMDLSALRKMAIVVPTPGQTEQEYLAKYLEFVGLFCSQDQDKLDIISGIEVLKNRERELTFQVYNMELLDKALEMPPFNF